MDDKRIKETIEKDLQTLKESLIYKMSLGSKELYHSNVWAWLIDQDFSYVGAFFDDVGVLDGAKFSRVSREEGNRDLTIWFTMQDGSEKCVVIENKLKSIPDKKQLSKYAEDLHDRFLVGVLTGLIRPNIVSNSGDVLVHNKKWQFVSYSELSVKMRRITEESNSEQIKSNKNLILEYLDNNELINRIVSISIGLDKSFEEKSLEPIIDADLNETGLQDLNNKMLGSLFVRYVEERLKDDGIEFENFRFEESFHNKKPTLDFRLINDEETEGHFLKIGIQIEGYQYRRTVDRIDRKAKEIFDEFSGSFFDERYNKCDKFLSFPGDAEERPTTMRGDFCQYNGKNSDNKTICTVYQYSTLKGEDFLFENLYSRIKNDLSVSDKLIREIYKKTR